MRKDFKIGEITGRVVTQYNPGDGETEEPTFTVTAYAGLGKVLEIKKVLPHAVAEMVKDVEDRLFLELRKLAKKQSLETQVEWQLESLGYFHESLPFERRPAPVDLTQEMLFFIEDEHIDGKSNAKTRMLPDPSWMVDALHKAGLDSVREMRLNSEKLVWLNRNRPEVMALLEKPEFVDYVGDSGGDAWSWVTGAKAGPDEREFLEECLLRFPGEEFRVVSGGWPKIELAGEYVGKFEWGERKDFVLEMCAAAVAVRKDGRDMIFVHDIKLPETSDFAKKFNECSELYQKSKDESLTQEERDRYLDMFWSYKYCLEQGII